MRLIDADALKEAVKGNGTVLTVEHINYLIDNAPTVITDNKGYNQGFKDGKECTLVSIDAIEDITDRMISIISEMDWEKLLKEADKRLQGEWLEDSGNIACSHCHTIWLYRRTDFCPNCGADMRGIYNE